MHETAVAYDVRSVKKTEPLAKLVDYRNSAQRRGVTVGACGHVAAAQADTLGVRVWEPPRGGGAAKVIFQTAAALPTDAPAASVAFLHSSVAERIGGTRRCDAATESAFTFTSPRAWPALLVAESDALRVLAPPW